MQPSESAALVWSDAFELGYAPLDAVHEEFVQVVTLLQTCPDDQLLHSLDLFFAHAKEHFGQEDDWMASTEFPPRQCHMDEHAAVLASAAEVRELVLQGQIHVARSFAAELARWFPGHADYLDSALAQWMFKRLHGGKPIVLKRNVVTPSIPRVGAEISSQ